ncbi:MAG: TIGR01906 family membrane protein [Anaerolineae bacterium]|nr:TIGR01906 family membrane protein [Anaerolineae bacterium]
MNDHQNAEPQHTHQHQSHRWAVIVSGVITFFLPFFLVLTGVRLVATETFLHFEYHRPGFPDDRYGFSMSERLDYAPYPLHYMFSNADISYLADLMLDDEPMYTQRELRHMEDVKNVTRLVFMLYTVLCVGLALAIVGLAWQPATRHHLRRGLFNGGAFTLALIVTLVVLAIASWDFFFTGFHSLFFEGDTWLFHTSDTLIRLFPEQFWIDAVLAIGLFTTAGTLGTMTGTWLWERRTIHRQITQNGAANDPVPHE